MEHSTFVSEMFECFEECIVINKEERDLLEMVSQAHMCMSGPNYIIGNLRSLVMTEFPGTEGVFKADRKKAFPNACESYKSMVLQIPYFYPAADVSEGFTDPFDEGLKEKYENSILLAPVANSLPGPDIEFWEGLAEELNKLGYIVYTNVKSGEFEITGTIRLETSIREIFNLSRYFHCVISSRSGLCDTLAFQKEAAHIVISPEVGTMEFNDIRIYEKNDKVFNTYYWDKSKECLINEVINILSEV